ncbi:MAG: archaellin/type IV pilin N-terminal domain-containing protein [archaeon]
MKRELDKRGISPVVATVLLIALVVAIALILFLWFRGLDQDVITKFGGRNIELVCGDVAFEASYYSGTLYVSNLGNVPIFSMKMKTYGEGSYTTKDLSDPVEFSEDWPSVGLNQGDAAEVSIGSPGGDKVTLIPVLIGSSDEGDRSHVCDENQYGYDILI